MALVAVEGAGLRLVAVAGVGVDRADHPVRRDPPGDPDPAVRSCLEVLAEHGREQRGRLGEGWCQRLPLHRQQHGLPVTGERVDERRPGVGIVPVGGGLAACAVVVVAPEDRAQRGLPLVRGREHAPDRAPHEGDRVHGRDRVVQRGGVEHPPHADQARDLGDLERALEDPLRALRAGQACAHVDEHGVGEARGVERQPAGRVLPAGVEREPLDRLAVRQPFQTLEDHHDRDHQGRHRAPADAGREQVAEQLVGEQFAALAMQQGMDRVRPDQRLDEGARIAEQVSLVGRGSLRHQAYSCDPARSVRSTRGLLVENRSCARACPSAGQNARFTPAT